MRCVTSRILVVLSSVPSAPPEFTVNITATNITLTWQPLPTCEQNGVITSYTIAYRMEGTMDMNFTEMVVGAASLRAVVTPSLTAVVTPLTPYTNYTIKMAASTSVGQGEFGREVTVQTNESSKQNILIYNTFHMVSPRQPVAVRVVWICYRACLLCVAVLAPLS